MSSNENESKLVTNPNQTAIIPLTNDKICFVDRELLESLSKYKWRAVKSHRCWYAKTTVGHGDNQVDLSMHRLIAHPPKGYVVHHRNRNSLDNRRANLLNMTRYNHERLHRNNNVLVKFSEVVTPAEFQTILESL